MMSNNKNIQPKFETINLGKRIAVYVLAIGVIALLLYLAVGDRGSAFKVTEIESGTPIAGLEESAWKGPALTIGFIPQGNAVFMAKKWQPLADYLAEALKRPVEMEFRSSYREIIDALVNGEMDLCLTGAFTYVLTREAADIRPLVRRKKFGSPYYHSVIIVRKDSGLKTFSDLAGKSFAFTDKESTTGYLLPVAMMRRKGIADPQSYFSEVIFAGNHDSALLSVYTGNVDGAALSTTRWRPDNPIVAELRIIWKSDPVYLGPFSVRGGLDEKLITGIKDAFLKIGRTPETRKLADYIQVQGFEVAHDSDYDSIRRAKKWIF